MSRQHREKRLKSLRAGETGYLLIRRDLLLFEERYLCSANTLDLIHSHKCRLVYASYVMSASLTVIAPCLMIRVRTISFASYDKGVIRIYARASGLGAVSSLNVATTSPL